MKFFKFIAMISLAGGLNGCQYLFEDYKVGNANHNRFSSEQIKKYTTLLNQDPKNDKIHLALGWLYLQDKKYDLAISYFNNSIRESPKNTVAYLGLGIAYKETQRNEYAKTVYKRVLDFHPNWYLANYQLGKIHLSEKNRDLAFNKVENLMDQNRLLANKLISEIYP